MLRVCNGHALLVALCCIWGPGGALGKTPEAELAHALRHNQTEDMARALDLLAQKNGARDPYEQTFYKGLLELRRDRLDQAIALFATVPATSTYFWDARNNMAAIHARLGKTELAKSVLEDALGAHPSLAVLNKNLNNLRAHMAAKSYASALQMFDSGKTDRPNLVLLSGPLVREQNKIAGLPPADKPQMATPPTSTVAATSAPATTSGSTPASSTKPSEPDTVVAENKPSKTTAPAADKSESAEDMAAAAAAKSALMAWRSAWENKDIDGYIQAYAKDYSPSDGKSRAAWMRDRQDRISSKGSIRIRLEKVETQVMGEHQVRVRFRQHYDSDRFKSSSNKVVDFKRIDGQWRITAERTSEGAAR